MRYYIFAFIATFSGFNSFAAQLVDARPDE